MNNTIDRAGKHKINTMIRLLNESINENEKLYTKRNNRNIPEENKISLKNFIYSSMKMLQNSTDTVSADLKINSNLKISRSAITKRRFTTDHLIFKNINNHILTGLYDRNNKFIKDDKREAFSSGLKSVLLIQ